MFILFALFFLSSLLQPLEEAYGILQKEYSLFMKSENPSFCPHSLKEYFQKKIYKEECLVPRSDHFLSRSAESGSHELICLLLEESGISLKSFQFEKEVSCLSH